MDIIALLITIYTGLILITMFVVGYIIECQIRNLKNKHSRQEIVDYINSMPVYVRDEQGNVLKHCAHISGFNSDDYTKIIIDVKK